MTAATDDAVLRADGGAPGARAARSAESARLSGFRLASVATLFALVFLLVGGRLISLSVDGAVGTAAARADRLTDQTPAPAAVRGEITDRDGVLLAASLPVASLYADGLLIADPQDAAARLATVLTDIDVEAVAESIDTDNRFVYLRRGLTPEEHYRINALGVPGFAFEMEPQRFYPAGSLTGHIVGYTDIDEFGLAGIEREFQERLNAGETVHLSVDLGMQAMLHEELITAVQEVNAIGAIGVILAVGTGEVMAMVSLPDFDPVIRAEEADEQRFNRVVQGVYEMGSTFKIFNTAMVLENGVATLDSSYDATNPIRINGFTISDYHGQYRWLTVQEIFRYSSNIGSARMAVAAGAERQRAMLEALGLTSTSPIELPEAARPLVPRQWPDVTTMTVSFGHGIAVSPMQLASATAAVMGDGLYRAPTLLRHDPAVPAPAERVLSSETSQQMRWLMRSNVEIGTGGNAEVEGYLVGGKTGTAEKAVGRGYDGNALLSSFIAAFPMDDPEFVVLVMLDEPQLPRSQGRPTGGRVAAPVVRRVIERLGPMAGIPPILPEQPEFREVSVNAADGPGTPTLEAGQ